MTRKRVTASEKKTRHEWAVRQIDAGYLMHFKLSAEQAFKEFEEKANAYFSV